MIADFNHQGPAMVIAMHELKVNIFEHLVISYWELVYDWVRYTENTTKGTSCNKYQSGI